MERWKYPIKAVLTSIRQNVAVALLEPMKKSLNGAEIYIKDFGSFRLVLTGGIIDGKQMISGYILQRQMKTLGMPAVARITFHRFRNWGI